MFVLALQPPYGATLLPILAREDKLPFGMPDILEYRHHETLRGV